MKKILLGALLLGIGTDLFIFQSAGLGLGDTLFILLFIIAIPFILNDPKKVLAQKNVITFIVLLLIGAITFTLFDSVYARELAMLGVFYIGALYVLACSGYKAFLPIEQYVQYDLHALELLPRSIGSIFRGLKNMSSKHILIQTVVGLIVLIPIGSIFLTLFSSADFMFGQWIKHILSIDLVIEIIQHGLVIPVFSILWLIPLSVLDQMQTHTQASTWNVQFVKEKLWIHIVIGGLIILFGIFLGFQSFYLFGGDNAFANIDFTYAEYAKKGFYELIVVAVLVLGMVSIYHTFGKQHRIAGLVMTTVLMLETFPILVSAWMRLSMYVDSYGLTSARHAGYWGLTMIGIALVTTLILNWMTEYRRLTPSIICFTMALGGIIYPFFTPDRVVAKDNIERVAPYTLNDVRKLPQRMGADGLQYYLSYLDTYLPKDISVNMDNANSDMSETAYTKEQLCTFINGRLMEKGNKHMSQNIAEKRKIFENLSKKRPWHSWNRAQQNMIRVYKVPKWTVLGSTEALEVYCGNPETATH